MLKLWKKRCATVGSIVSPTNVTIRVIVFIFAERKPKSVWSKLNKTRVANLMKLGLMTSAGIAKIDIAKANGSWSVLDEAEELKMPAELQKAFAKNKKALKNFEAFPSSVKKGIYHWIINAKQTITRDKRVKETVEKAASNIRANQWRK
jgi:uncharacterized protein YdeI (YjbR/CyaY-like superfamily)